MGGKPGARTGAAVGVGAGVWAGLGARPGAGVEVNCPGGIVPAGADDARGAAPGDMVDGTDMVGCTTDNGRGCIARFMLVFIVGNPETEGGGGLA